MIIPTYNHGNTLVEVVRSVLPYCSDVLVVNDGSTDATHSLLTQLKYERVQCIEYARNRGKGYALRKGFAYAKAHGYEYAITMDSDGQHLAENLIDFIEAIEVHSGAFIVGQRPFTHEHMPGANRWANEFSSFWYRVETGIRLADTQSGFRAYPVGVMARHRGWCNGYTFELEALVRLAWRGVRVVPLPIKVHYARPEERVSHFVPWRDFSKMSILHTLYTIVGLLVVRPVRAFWLFFARDVRTCFHDLHIHDRQYRTHVAASVGWGILCSMLPIWGYQTLFALASAHWMHLNKVITLLFCNFSIPPVMPFIIYGSLWVGCSILGSSMPILTQALTLDIALNHLKVYLIGSVVLACCSGMVAFVLTHVVLRIIQWGGKRHA